jgi:hypothetical protein
VFLEKEAKDLRFRFTGFVKVVGEMDIDSIEAYTYSKLFTILPRDQSRESMEKSYAFFKGKAELDSVRVDTIKPVFHIDKGSYAIAIYSMVIRMPLDSTENSIAQSSIDTTRKTHLINGTYATPQSTLKETLMRNEYGIGVTGFEEADGKIKMRIRVVTIAVKDEFAKQWSFFTVTNDQELINKLFPKKVLEKLATYN